MIFCRGIDYAQDDSAIQEAWERARDSSDEFEQMGICLVTGKQAEISRIHKTIKGVPGAQSSGAALVSFMEKNKVIMHQWENMQSLLIPQPLIISLASGSIPSN